MGIAIHTIEAKQHASDVKELLLEYASIRNFDQALGDFDKELDELPGEYAKPHGLMLIAYWNDMPAGCISIRKLKKDVCEMKRLYVKADYRGNKIGKALVRSKMLKLWGMLL